MQQFQTMVYGSERATRGSVESAALLRYIESCEISRSGASEPQYQASVIKESYKEDFQVHRTRHVHLHTSDDERREQSSPFGLHPGNLIRIYSGEMESMKNSGWTQWPS